MPARVPTCFGDATWEEVQPQFLIRELAGLNPGDPKLERMVQITKPGYDRKMAPELLALATGSDGKKDETVNEIPLRQNLLGTLEIETNRAGEDTKMIAQNERELLMKEQFLAHLNHASVLGTPSKVLPRFGRNHLHRGYDGRGISTLGNFIAEYAIEHRERRHLTSAHLPPAGRKLRWVRPSTRTSARMAHLCVACGKSEVFRDGFRPAAPTAIAPPDS